MKRSKHLKIAGVLQVAQSIPLLLFSGLFFLVAVGSGCRSIAEEIGYHHSDEKKRGISQSEYDRETRRRLERQEEEEAQFNRMRNQ